MSRLALFVLLCIVLLDATAFGMVYPLFSPMLFGADATLVHHSTSETVRGLLFGILLSLPPFVQMVVAPWIGRFSDRRGRRPALMLCLGAGLLSSLFVALSIELNSLFGLILSRGCLGVCLVSYAIVNAYIVDASREEDRGRRLAWVHSAFGAGVAIGPLLASFLVSETIFGTLSYSRPFLMNAVLALISGILVLFFLPETHAGYKESETPSFRELFSVEKTVVLLLLSSFCLCFGWSMWFEFMPVLWIRWFGFSSADIGLYLSYGALWYFLASTFLVGCLLKRFCAQLLFEKAALLSAFCVGLMVFVSVPAFYWLLLPLQNIFIAFLFPLSVVILSNHSSPKNRGKIMGLQSSAESLGFGLSPCLAGPLLGIHLVLPTVIAVVCLIVASVIIRSVRKGGEKALSLA